MISCVFTFFSFQISEIKKKILYILVVVAKKGEEPIMFNIEFQSEFRPVSSLNIVSIFAPTVQGWTSVVISSCARQSNLLKTRFEFSLSGEDDMYCLNNKSPKYKCLV